MSYFEEIMAKVEDCIFLGRPVSMMFQIRCYVKHALQKDNDTDSVTLKAAKTVKEGFFGEKHNFGGTLEFRHNIFTSLQNVLFNICKK